MKITTHTRIPVVCALGRRPEYIDWLRHRVSRDRLLNARTQILIPRNDRIRDAALHDAEVYATYRYSIREHKCSPGLKWLHLGLAGIDSALFPAFKRGHAILTSSVGLHDDTVPQAAWGFILSFATGLHVAYGQKEQREWNRKDIVLNRSVLRGQRLLVIGVGRIGQRIGRLGKQFGMTVWGVRHSKKRDTVSGFDRIVSATGLQSVLPEADYVVLVVPGGKPTRGMIGAAELRLMKGSAYLINVARGSLVNEKALIRALERDQIAGAGLDVFDQEPLPKTHPFYRLPNVAMTPHISGDTADYAYRATELFLKNLRRYCLGKPLTNQVDKRRGY